MVDQLDNPEDQETLKKRRVLVFGDVMLDRYTFVRTDRRAQEAKIPVWDEIRDECRPGGAANVAANLQSLGGKSVEVVLMGAAAEHWIWQEWTELSVIATDSLMVKHRFVTEDGKIIFRADNFKRFRDETIEKLSSPLWQALRYNRFDMIVISDYDKGTVTEKFVSMIKLHGCPVIVDSKRKDLSFFESTMLLKVNESEYSMQSSQMRDPAHPCVESLFEHVIVTYGSKGAELSFVERSKSSANKYVVHRENFPAEHVKQIDVTGCGDTHTAAVALSLLNDPLDVRKAVRFGNKCAASVVQKFGTSVP